MPRDSVNGRPVPAPRRETAVNVDGIKRDIIVIGASAGGVQALSTLFAGLSDLRQAVVCVVLHRGREPSELTYVLGRRSALPIVEPDRNVRWKSGTIYVAPPDQHLLFAGNTVVVQRGPREHGTRPSIDPLFRSAAESYGRRVVGLLLTGSGEDGVSGLIAISDADGLTLAQDPEEAYMPYLPLNAIRYDDVAGVLPLDKLGPALAALAEGNRVIAQSVASRRAAPPRLHSLIG